MLGVVNQANMSTVLNLFHQANENFQEKNQGSLEKIRALCVESNYSILQNPSARKDLQIRSMKDILRWFAMDRNQLPESAKNFNIDEAISEYCQETIKNESTRDSTYQELKAILIDALTEANAQE